MQLPDFRPEHDFAVELDARDELATFRHQFVFADPHLIYMDGNSLGRLPKRTAQLTRQLVHDGWGDDLVRGWSRGWFDAPARVGDKIGRLVGSSPGQIIVADSTTVNLFKLAMAALQLRPARHRIVTDAMNFPSDLYVLQGCAQLLGGRHHVCAAPSSDGIRADMRGLLAAIDEETALVSLSHATFKSGFMYDIQEVTARAHAVGALVLWDLSHSVGVVPIELERWHVDMAVGCTYKYLNGGPGAPAFLFVRRGLQGTAVSPVWGWFGQQRPFAFEPGYLPAPGVTRFQVGTPPVLSLLAVEPAVEMVLEAGIERIRAKSEALTSYLVQLYDAILAPLGFGLGSPRDPQRRGSHISLRHTEAYRITQALIREMNVLPDFREPDNLRFGLAPLYTSFSEVWLAVERTRRIMNGETYRRYAPERNEVT